jgi:arabinofuranosyltransferase
MQTDKISRSPRTAWMAAVVIAAIALATRLVAGPRTIDDAYITFRYARNLAEGLGLVYNPGQQVLGTTTPLYAGLMSLAWALGLRDLPVVALVVNALADALTAVVLYRLALRLETGWVVAVGLGLAWAVSPMSVTFAIGGMETSVVILFLVASLAAYVAGRSRLSSALMALAVLTRPDALIAAGLLFVDMGLRPLLARDGGPLVARLRRLPWAEALIFCGLLLPWVLVATAYYGSPLPQSVAAKVRAYQLSPFAALIRLLQHFSTPFFEHEVFGRFWPAVGLPLYLVLYLVGGLAMVRRANRSLPMIPYPLLYVAVFSAANPLIFRWYLAPPLPFYFLGILVGVSVILADLARRLKRERVGTWATSLVVVVWLVFSLNAYTLHPDHGPDRPAPEMAWFKLELLYRQAAKLIKPDLQPGDVIAAADIGTVGWFSEAPILDTLGLISPEATPYYPLDPSLLVIQYAISPDLIRDLQPEYLVALEVYVRYALLPADWFHEQYDLLEKLDTDIYGSDGMLIFHRRP